MSYWNMEETLKKTLLGNMGYETIKRIKANRYICEIHLYQLPKTTSSCGMKDTLETNHSSSQNKQRYQLYNVKQKSDFFTQNGNSNYRYFWFEIFIRFYSMYISTLLGNLLLLWNVVILHLMFMFQSMYSPNPKY